MKRPTVSRLRARRAKLQAQLENILTKAQTVATEETFGGAVNDDPAWARMRERYTCDADGVFALMRDANPRFEALEHFRGYVHSIVTSAHSGGLRLLFSAPVQMGKSTSTLAALAILCAYNPHLRHAYATFSQRKANSVSKLFRLLLRTQGVETGGTLAEMTLPGGGSVLFTSMKTGINGQAVDGLFVVDDPTKDAHAARSLVEQEALDESMNGSVLPRLHPGASIIVMMARWCRGDLIDKLIASKEYKSVVLAAICEDENDGTGRKLGESLWSKARPLAWLEDKRRIMGEGAFLAMFQQRPPDGVVGIMPGVTFYRQLPTSYQGAFGCDFAYTSKTSSDESVLVELWREYRTEPDPLRPDAQRDASLYYVVACDARQQEREKFMPTLFAAHQRRPDWPLQWRGSSIERDVATLVRQTGLPLRFNTVVGDKLLTNSMLAEAWRCQRILLPDPTVYPQHAKWVRELTDQCNAFTGRPGDSDDRVDALGNAHFILSRVADATGGTGVVRGSSGR